MLYFFFFFFFSGKVRKKFTLSPDNSLIKIQQYGLGPQSFFHYLPYKDLLGNKIADNFAVDAYFLLLMSSFLTFKFTHHHDQLLFLLSSVKVNTCQFIPVTAHPGSLFRGVLRFTCFPEIKRKQNKLLIFKKNPTC